jgi:hypothetical protein
VVTVLVFALLKLFLLETDNLYTSPRNIMTGMRQTHSRFFRRL